MGGLLIPGRRGPPRLAGRGYLLIEVLVTLLIAATLTSAIVPLQLALHRQGRDAADRVLAATLAEHRAESLLGLIRAGATVGGGQDVFPATAITDPQETVPGHWRTWSVAPIQELLAIDIEVAWPDPDGTPDRRQALHGMARKGTAADGGWALIAHQVVISP